MRGQSSGDVVVKGVVLVGKGCIGVSSKEVEEVQKIIYRSGVTLEGTGGINFSIGEGCEGGLN